MAEQEKSEGIKNTAQLRKMLLKTIEDVRNGAIDPKQARTIAAISTTILNSAKLDLDFLRFRAMHEKVEGAQQNVLNLIAE
jgi:hypothetical protein